MKKLPQIFIHMHKCAGCSVVAGALAQGLRLPEKHLNGNLVHADGKPLFFEEMNNEEFVALAHELSDGGVEFFAMEWDIPQLETLDHFFLARCFTIIRSPWSRAVSNFRMDLINGWVGPHVTSFQTYFNNSTYYRSDNYFVRKLCRLGREPIRSSHFVQAVTLLKRIGKVVVLENGHLKEELLSLGIRLADKIHNETTGWGDLFDKYDWRIDLNPTLDDQKWFYERNLYDFMLFNHFLGFGPPDLQPKQRPLERKIAQIVAS